MITLICFLVLLFGGINWLSIGALQFDIVAGIFGTQASIFSRILYILVGVATIWIIFQTIRQRGKLNVLKDRLDVPALDKTDRMLAEKSNQN